MENENNLIEQICDLKKQIDYLKKRELSMTAALESAFKRITQNTTHKPINYHEMANVIIKQHQIILEGETNKCKKE